jgi:mRNA interferase MazF
MGRGVLRGDILWAELDPVVGPEQAGRRPVVVLSQDVFNARTGTVIAMALSSQAPRVAFPLVFEVASTRLPERSWVKIGQVRILAVERLGRKIGRMSVEEMDTLVEGLNEIIGA